MHTCSNHPERPVYADGLCLRCVRAAQPADVAEQRAQAYANELIGQPLDVLVKLAKKAKLELPADADLVAVVTILAGTAPTIDPPAPSDPLAATAGG